MWHFSLVSDLLVVLFFPEDNTSWICNWLDSISKDLRTVRQAVEGNYGFSVISITALVGEKSFFTDEV